MFSRGAPDDPTVSVLRSGLPRGPKRRRPVDGRPRRTCRRGLRCLAPCLTPRRRRGRINAAGLRPSSRPRSRGRRPPHRLDLHPSRRRPRPDRGSPGLATPVPRTTGRWRRPGPPSRRAKNPEGRRRWASLLGSAHRPPTSGRRFGSLLIELPIRSASRRAPPGSSPTRSPKAGRNFQRQVQSNGNRTRSGCRCRDGAPGTA